MPGASSVRTPLCRLMVRARAPWTLDLLPADVVARRAGADSGCFLCVRLSIGEFLLTSLADLRTQRELCDVGKNIDMRLDLQTGTRSTDSAVKWCARMLVL